jgi:hypothetical protein
LPACIPDLQRITRKFKSIRRRQGIEILLFLLHYTFECASHLRAGDRAEGYPAILHLVLCAKCVAASRASSLTIFLKFQGRDDPWEDRVSVPTSLKETRLHCVWTRSLPVTGTPTVLVGILVASSVEIWIGSDAQAARINPPMKRETSRFTTSLMFYSLLQYLNYQYFFKDSLQKPIVPPVEFGAA